MANAFVQTRFVFNVKTPSGMLVEMSAVADAAYQAKAILEAQVGVGNVMGIKRMEPAN